MTPEEIAGFVIALLVMVLGVFGSFLPGLPGTPLILVAAIGHKFWFREEGASLLVLGILAFLTVLSLVLEYLGAFLGTKKAGATRRGIIGALVGLIVGGLFFNIPGLIFGPFLGALLFEWIGGRTWEQAAKAGLGAAAGLFFGTLGKLVCAITMVGLFAGHILYLNSR